MKMLIVDDSKVMRSMLQGLARKLSFRTVEAGDGAAGLNKLLEDDPQEPFDVALIDLDMPVMTGLQMIRKVRCHRQFDSVKLLVVTVETSMPRVKMALQAGADDYLMKPVSREALFEKLQILGLS